MHRSWRIVVILVGLFLVSVSAALAGSFAPGVANSTVYVVNRSQTPISVTAVWYGNTSATPTAVSSASLSGYGSAAVPTPSALPNGWTGYVKLSSSNSNVHISAVTVNLFYSTTQYAQGTVATADDGQCVTGATTAYMPWLVQDDEKFSVITLVNPTSSNYNYGVSFFDHNGIPWPGNPLTITLNARNKYDLNLGQVPGSWAPDLNADGNTRDLGWSGSAKVSVPANAQLCFSVAVHSRHGTAAYSVRTMATTQYLVTNMTDDFVSHDDFAEHLLALGSASAYTYWRDFGGNTEHSLTDTAVGTNKQRSYHSSEYIANDDTGLSGAAWDGGSVDTTASNGVVVVGDVIRQYITGECCGFGQTGGVSSGKSELWFPHADWFSFVVVRNITASQRSIAATLYNADGSVFSTYGPTNVAANGAITIYPALGFYGAIRVYETGGNAALVASAALQNGNEISVYNGQ